MEFPPVYDINFPDSILLPYESARVLVLGASGFIGNWLAHYLSASNCDLHLVVRDSQWRFTSASGNPRNLKIWTVDLADFQAVQDFIKDLCPSIVFNLAGYGVDQGERDEQIAYQINARLVEAIVQSLANLSDTAWDGLNLVHVGSALEYGNIGGNLLETSDPNPSSLYGRSKLDGTKAVTRYGKTWGLRGVTTRLFTIYGPGEHSTRLLPCMIQAARTKTPVQLTAGQQKRDFTFVLDVVEGLLRLGVSSARPGEIVNLATGHLSTVRQFVETAARILEISESNLLFGAIPTRAEEMEHEAVSIHRLQSLLTWKPEIGLSEGITRTLTIEEKRIFDSKLEG